MRRRGRPRTKPDLDTYDSPLTPLARAYSHNILVGTWLRRLSSKVVRSIAEIETVRWLADLPGEKELDGTDDEIAVMRRALRYFLKCTGHKARYIPRPPEPLVKNLQLFSEIFHLDQVSVEVLCFVLTGQQHGDLRELCDTLGDIGLQDCARAIATGIDAPASQVAPLISPSGKLAGQGLLDISTQIPNTLFNKVELLSGLAEMLLDPELDRERLLDRFVPEAPPSTLCLDDFRHMRESCELARRLLGAALEKKVRGVNILLYGHTGTGKSELSRLLAQELEVPLLAAGQRDEDGNVPTAHERLCSLRLAQRVVSGAPALLLFDEIEDLFQGSDFSSFLKFGGAKVLSKQWFNLLLEEAPTPTIWISNRVTGIDPAFLRRFSLVVEFRPLAAGQRARVLSRHLGKEHDLSDEDVQAVAQRFTGSQAQYSSAVACARLLDESGRPQREIIEQLMAPTEKIVQQRDPRREVVFDPSRYNLDVVNTPDNLNDLVMRLEGWQPGRNAGVTMCLYGLPGTGKSEFVHFLAWRMGRRVVARRGSDILSMWVGGTEQNLARAFEEAEDDEAVLLFDEVDSLLRERGLAQRSWEITQVNEFLQQIERFRGMVACTTNLWKDLDAAAMRRFVFKLEFRPLRPEQAVAMFDLYFVKSGLCWPAARDRRETSRSIGRIRNLTPGDFATVARRTDALGEQLEPLELIARLEREVEMKRDSGRKIGF